MAVTGFSHYNLRAPRELLETLRTFYCDVVGLKEGPRPNLGSLGYWLYIEDQEVLHLSETKPGERPATKVVTTLDHVAFSCTDFEAMQAHLQEQGIHHQSALITTTGTRQLFFRDPAGNRIEFNFSPDS